ncbi:MAG: OsmC family peroxiredoxin, partial [Acidobacteria bacterium]
VACAGVTLQAVATSLGIEVRSGVVRADGELDFRGTLAVDRDAPVGFRSIRLIFEIDAEAGEEELATLLRLTERYCVVLQTIRDAPPVTATIATV